MNFKYIFLILSLIFIGMQQKSYAVELVVNVENPVESLSLDKVRYIFLMRTRNWENGEKIKVYVNDWESEIHSDFSRDILKVIPHRINSAWERKKYSGMGEIPKIVSEQEMVEILSKDRNAIGYVSELTDEMSVHLKKIKVE